MPNFVKKFQKSLYNIENQQNKILGWFLFPFAKTSQCGVFTRCGDLFQKLDRFAIIKSTIFYFDILLLIIYYNIKIFTTFKRPVFDARHTLRNHDACQ